MAAPNAASKAPSRASRPMGPDPVFASCPAPCPAAPPPPPWVTVSALPVLPTAVDCVEPWPVPDAPVAVVDWVDPSPVPAAPLACVDCVEPWPVPAPAVSVVDCSEPTPVPADRKSTRLNSSHQIISYAVFCLKKKKKRQSKTTFHYT